MTFTDIISHPSKLLHSLSMSDDFNEDDQKVNSCHQNLKGTNTSMLNLYSRQQQPNNINEQQQTCFLQPPSDLSRSISNRSITFSSVFDTLENGNINKDNHVTFDVGKSEENEDLIIIVPNKYVTNETTGKNINTEPYPFRSEIPSCSLAKSHSSTNMISSSYSGKKLLHHHRPKKLRHPIKTMHFGNTINRSTSAPNMLLSSPTSIATNDHHKSLKTLRRWFKSSSFGRVLQSFIKHPFDNRNTIKQKSRHKSTTLPKYSDLIY